MAIFIFIPYLNQVQKVLWYQFHEYIEMEDNLQPNNLKRTILYHFDLN